MGRWDFGTMAGWGNARMGSACIATGTHYRQPVPAAILPLALEGNRAQTFNALRRLLIRFAMGRTFSHWHRLS